jgi:membrane protein YqaA with SNARE-associated domain
MSVLNTLLEWTQQTLLPLGNGGLFILAFIESSFFPIPPDILLILLVLADPSQTYLYVFICTIGSTLGGMFGYSIGYYLGKPILYKLFKKEKIAKVHRLFEKYEAWAIFIAGFSPIPYKLFTLAGGSLFINFKKFVIASFISRGLRYLIIGTIVMLYGQEVVALIDQYFALFTTAVVIVLVVIYLIYKRMKKKGKIDFL